MAELSDFSGVLGQEIYTPLFESLGFSNWNDPSNFYINEGGGMSEQDWMPSSDAYDFINSKGFDFNWTPEENGGGVLGMTGNGLDQTFRQKGDSDFTQLVNMVAPALGGWALGGGLSQLFGGGMLGGGLGQGIASGTMSKGMGGSFGSGFLSGAFSGAMNGLAKGTPATVGNNPSAYVPATPGTSVAGMAGITNPTLAGVVNRGVGNTLGGLVGGKSGSEALKSGLLGATTAGLNSVGSNAMNSFYDSLKGWLGPDTTGTEADYSTGSTSYGSNYMAPGQSALRAAGLFPEQSNVPPSSSNFQTLDTIGLPSLDMNPYANASYGESGYKPIGVSALEQAGLRGEMSYAPPGTEGDTGGAFLSNAFQPSGDIPTKSIQSAGQSSFSLPSIFGNVGSSLGNFALNNAGDLASMLYGFYNNRKQQKALGQQISGLQSLYGQNSPYAQQLRAKLNAQAAQSGRRSNVAGRETQLQAMLADRNAQMAPTLMQLNQARGQLKNSLGSNTLSMLNKMGAFQGLANMFKPPMGNYSMVNNTNDYNLLGSLEGMR